MVAGVGGRIEWSLRRIRANSVIGMWQEMHWLPARAGFVVRVGGSVLHPLLVARQAGVVGFGRVLEPVAPARGVAMDAVQLAGLGARAQPPLGVGVVLAQVAAIGIEIGILERHEIEVIEVAVARARSSWSPATSWRGTGRRWRCAARW